ncbi:hypothetical protein ACIQFZ_37855 [Streptomyces sp. NPDC093064]|uniref:hypothetical protein n=1 Tax=unclassified Streptomyces TaxID=2593676 RepID=UPI00369E385D
MTVEGRRRLVERCRSRPIVGVPRAGETLAVNVPTATGYDLAIIGADDLLWTDNARLDLSRSVMRAWQTLSGTARDPAAAVWSALDDLGGGAAHLPGNEP